MKKIFFILGLACITILSKPSGAYAARIGAGDETIVTIDGAYWEDVTGTLWGCLVNHSPCMIIITANCNYTTNNDFILTPAAGQSNVVIDKYLTAQTATRFYYSTVYGSYDVYDQVTMHL